MSEFRRRLSRQPLPVQLGWFVLIFVALEATLLILAIAAGINPTLILSVIAAPVWIVAVIGSYKLSRWIARPK